MKRNLIRCRKSRLSIYKIKNTFVRDLTCRRCFAVLLFCVRWRNFVYNVMIIRVLVLISFYYFLKPAMSSAISSKLKVPPGSSDLETVSCSRAFRPSILFTTSVTVASREFLLQLPYTHCFRACREIRFLMTL